MVLMWKNKQKFSLHSNWLIDFTLLIDWLIDWLHPIWWYSLLFIRINWNFDEKSQFSEIKWRNLWKIAKFLKNLGYQKIFLDKIGAQSIMWKFCLKDIFILISFHITYTYFLLHEWKKILCGLFNYVILHLCV